MKHSDLLFVGIAGSVVALNKATGKQAWTTRLKGYGFVNVAVQDERVVATVYGEVFCLEPVTGRILWHNPLKGLGRGLAGIAVAANVCNGNPAGIAEQQRRDEEASAAATAAV